MPVSGSPTRFDPDESFGARMVDGATRFRVWAPDQPHVQLHLIDQNRLVLLSAGPDGVHTAEVDNVLPDERYCYRLAGGANRPDPASRFQPGGVHGPSQVVDSRFDWTDQNWTGMDCRKLVLYELHVGAFTGAGTYRAAVDRLDELVDLGITAIELMPLAEAPGRWNWGYDGVCLFAPNHNYGSPHELKQLIDAAHGKGLAVILDVVYNHFGPEGNYLADFGPYLSSRHSTPWGAAPNFDDADHAVMVRQFIVANAIYWLDEFHFDGLRIDAIHCTKDDSDPHFVTELSAAVKHWADHQERQAILIAESNVYDPELLAAPESGGAGFDAQWCDDFLHSLFAVVRPEEQLCHRIYQSSTDFDQTLRYGYVYRGSMRTAPRRQRVTARVDTSRLIYSLQNHDAVGNHPLGQRFHQLTSIETQQVAAALLLLAPAIPMLFMGEEFACPHPFRFFVDFDDPNLQQGILDGRRREYPQHDWDRGVSPTSERAFKESKIGRKSDGQLRLWDWYQSLIHLRRRWQLLGLLDDQRLTVDSKPAIGLYCLRYSIRQIRATVVARLQASSTSAIDAPRCQASEIVLNSRPGQTVLQPDHVIITVGQA